MISHVFVRIGETTALIPEAGLRLKPNGRTMESGNTQFPMVSSRHWPPSGKSILLGWGVRIPAASARSRGPRRFRGLVVDDDTVRIGYRPSPRGRSGRAPLPGDLSPDHGLRDLHRQSLFHRLRPRRSANLEGNHRRRRWSKTATSR